MQQIKDKNENLIATILNSKDFIEGTHWVCGYSDPFQIALMKYDAGKQFQRHIHKVRERIFNCRTPEIFIVFNGWIIATIYDLEKELITSVDLESGSLMIAYSGGHGFEVMEDGTCFTELKLGPMCVVEKDKEKF